jgi:hypothetical protein
MRAPWEASTQATKLQIRLQQQTSKSEITSGKLILIYLHKHTMTSQMMVTGE